jgi:hypothetical protein
MSVRIPRSLAALLAASLLASPALSQPAPARGPWSRTYGGAVSNQGLFDLRQLRGGRLVVAGYTGSFGGTNPSNWLMSLELATGDVQFQEVCSSAAGGFPDGAAIAADGGALFMGRDVKDLFTKHDAWLIRVDAGGGVVWSQGFTAAGDGKFFLFDAAELDDGSWIAAGSTSATDQPPQNAWIVRLSAAGVPLWQFEYGGGLADTLRSIVPTADGGFAATGWTNSSGAGSDDVWVLKIDGVGGIEWQQTFGGLDSDQAEQIVQLHDGGFAVAGSTNSRTPSGHAPWLLRLDAGGALLWHAAVASDIWGDLGAVAETNDGQLVVVGRVGEPGFPSNDLWCAKLAASSGKVLWQRAYEGQLGDFGSAVLPLAGMGYVVGGTWGWGFPGESIWLLRTDRAGGLAGCDLVRRTTYELVSPGITAQPGTAVRTPPSAKLQPVGADVSPSAAVVSEICS